MLITFAPTGYVNESRKGELETSAGGKFEIRTYYTRNYTQSSNDIQVLRPDEVKQTIVTVKEDSGMLAPVAGTLAGVLCVLLVVVGVLCRRGNEKIEFTENLRRLSLDMARRASGKGPEEKDFNSANHAPLENLSSQPADSLGEYPDKRFLGSDGLDS